ncbi:aspartate carbamoyltransferase regulatory subunit [Halobacterium wangiae]|uniref:aspartate carbamoyltransferase regulatory subunit n=1 Tax=Halobacterium wangiae TaxID=2902623 RepID=UPI001E39C38C|nr:aspartate carbamoyltransferase regulatory subunit [Halobacterium wangiae]
MTDTKLRVSKIQSGTVVDHVTAGAALHVLSLLGIDGHDDATVSLGMNVPSDRMGRKDVVKVEGRELSDSELEVLSLIAPEATINIIRDYDVVEKRQVERPDRVTDVLRCPNRDCITNAGEPVQAAFAVLDDGLRCEYCGEIVREDVTDYLQN